MNQFKEDMDRIQSIVNMIQLQRRRGNTDVALDELENLHAHVCDALNSAGRRRTSIFADQNDTKFN